MTAAPLPGPPAWLLPMLAAMLGACSSLPRPVDTLPTAVVVERSSGKTVWATPESLQAEAAAARALEAAQTARQQADARARQAKALALAQVPEPAGAQSPVAPSALSLAATPSSTSAAEVPIQRVLYFDFDSDHIREEFRPMIERRALALLAEPGRRLLLQGHADERGSREYNLSLGQRRAEAVLRALTVLGVSDAQLSAISFGDTRPAVEGSNELVWSQNRRVEMTAP